jgi:hypothetical protein
MESAADPAFAAEGSSGLVSNRKTESYEARRFSCPVSARIAFGTVPGSNFRTAETSMAQPFGDRCGGGVISASHVRAKLGRDISVARRRIVLAACVVAFSMAFIDSSVLALAPPSRPPGLLSAAGALVTPIEMPPRPAKGQNGTHPISRMGGRHRFMQPLRMAGEEFIGPILLEPQQRIEPRDFRSASSMHT